MLDVLLRFGIVGVLWLVLTMGCKPHSPLDNEQPTTQAGKQNEGPAEPTTNPNTCDDGTCCGEKGIYYRYRETYAGDTVMLVGNSLTFSKPIPTGTNQTWAKSAETCIRTAKPVDAVILEVLKRMDYETPIKCRIWGRLYTTDKIIGVVDNGPRRYFAVDRVVAVK